MQPGRAGTLPSAELALLLETSGALRGWNSFALIERLETDLLQSGRSILEDTTVPTGSQQAGSAEVLAVGDVAEPPQTKSVQRFRENVPARLSTGLSSSSSTSMTAFDFLLLELVSDASSGPLSPCTIEQRSELEVVEETGGSDLS